MRRFYLKLVLILCALSILISPAFSAILTMDPVTNFAGSQTGSTVSLTWTNPSSSFDSVEIRYSSSAFPETQTEGVSVYTGSLAAFDDTPPDTPSHYYSIFAKSTAGIWSEVTTVFVRNPSYWTFVNFDGNTYDSFTDSGGDFIFVDKLSNGNVVSTYAKGGNIYAQIMGADTSPVVAPFVVNTTTGGGRTFSAVRGLKNGGFAVVWIWSSGGLKIVKRVYDNDGNPVSAEETIDDVYDTNTEISGGRDFSVEPLDSGGFAVAYPKGSGRTLMLERFDSSGASVATSITIGTKDQAKSVRVSEVKDVGYFYSYQKKTGTYSSWNTTGVFSQRLDSSFNLISTPFQMSGGQNFYTYVETIDAGDGKIFSIHNGDVHNFPYGPYKMFARLFDSDGTLLKNINLDNSFRLQKYITKIEDDKFLVVYTDNNTNNYKIRGKILTVSGSTFSAGSALLFNIDLWQPKVTYASGRIVLAGHKINNKGVELRSYYYGWQLDSDQDGVYDDKDAFPYDASLQTAVTNSTILPVTTGLTVWLDGEKPHGDSGSFTSGEAIQTWMDFSGKGNHVSQTTGTYQPKVDSSVLNGKSAIGFDGTNDYLHAYNQTDLAPSALTFFTVTTGQSETKVQFIAGRGNTGDYGYWFGSEGTDRYTFSVGDNNSGTEFRTRMNDSNVSQSRLFSGRYDGATNELFKMGLGETSTENSGAIDYTYSTNFNVGNIGIDHSNMHVDRYLDGHIAEIIMYDRALTDAEMMDMSLYLSEKWGLTGTTDSDGDGLMDMYDALPKDPQILEYEVGSTFSWVNAEGKDVHLKDGQVQLTGEGDHINNLTLGSRSGFTGQLDMSGVVTVNTLAYGAGTGILNMLSGTLKLDNSNSSLTLSGGTLTPHDDKSSITINGAYTQNSTGILELDVSDAGISEKVIVNGNVNLSGTLAFNFPPGFSPDNDFEADILDTSGSISGDFDTMLGLPAAAPFHSWALHNDILKFDKDYTSFVSKLNGHIDDEDVVLAWTNPTHVDFDSVEIRMSTTAFPSSETEGSAVYSGTGTSVTLAGVSVGDYYYSIFTKDSSGNWSEGATMNISVSQDPIKPVSTLEKLNDVNDKLRILNNAVLSNGDIVAAYGGYTNNGVYFKVFDKNFNEIVPETRADSDTSKKVYKSVYVHAFDNGKFALIWRSSTSTSYARYVNIRVFNNDGSPVNSSDVLVADGSYNYYVNTAVNDSNEVLIVYDDGSNLKARVYDSNGNPVTGANTILSSDATSGRIGLISTSSGWLMVYTNYESSTLVLKSMVLTSSLGADTPIQLEVAGVENHVLLPHKDYFKFFSTNGNSYRVQDLNSDGSVSGSVTELFQSEGYSDFMLPKVFAVAKLSDEQYNLVFKKGDKGLYSTKMGGSNSLIGSDYLLFDDKELATLGFASAFDQNNKIFFTYTLANGKGYSASNYDAYGAVISTGLGQDSDSDGVVDTNDAFPNDPSLQTMPSHSSVLPVTDKLELWLDASEPHGDGPAILDGNTFQTWVDFSGKKNHASQTVSAELPSFETGELNGKPVVRFDGVDDVLSIGNLSSYMYTDFTAFVVYKTDAKPSSRYNLLSQGSKTPDLGWSMAIQDNSGAKSDIDLKMDSGSNVSAESGIDEFEGQILGLKVSSANNDTKTFYNLGLTGTFNTEGRVLSPWGSRGVSIGAIMDGGVESQYADVDIAEIIIYKKSLSQSDIDSVHAYLKSKWGIVEEYVVDGTTNITSALNIAVRDRFVVGKNGSGTAVVKTGGDIDSPITWMGKYSGSSGTIEIQDGDLFNSGDVVVGYRGAGSLVLSGGTVSINGTLKLTEDPGSSASVSMSGGELKVSRIESGSGTVGSTSWTGGTLHPKNVNINLTLQGTDLDVNSELNIDGDLTLSGGSVLIIDADAATDWSEPININGDFNVGGTLQLNVQNPESVDLDTTLQLFNVSSSYSGEFTSVTGLPAAPDYHMWDTSKVHTEGKLTIIKDMNYWVGGGASNTASDEWIITSDSSRNGKNAALHNGNIAHAYIKSSNLYFIIKDRNGNEIVPKTLVKSGVWSDHRNWDMQVLPSGKFAIVYASTSPDTYISIFNPDGTVHLADRYLSNIGGGRQRIGVNSSGVIAVATGGNSTANPYKVTVMDEDGNESINDLSIPGQPSNYAYSMTLPLDDGSFYVIGADYGSKDQIMVQKFNSSFTQEGSTKYILPKLSSGIYQFPEAIILENGKVIISVTERYSQWVIRMDQNLNVEQTKEITAAGPYLDYQSFIAPMGDSKFLLAYEESTKLGYTGYTNYMILNSDFTTVQGEIDGHPNRTNYINDAKAFRDGTVLLSYFVSWGGYYGSYIRLFEGSLLLDRDANGVADIHDPFPDDPALSAMPSHSVLPPVTSGLQLWLDGQAPYGDSISLSNGDAMTYWIDFSGNDRYFTELDSAQRPNFKTSAIGAKSAVYFDQDTVKVKPGVALSSAYTVFAAYDTTEFADNESGVRTLISRGQQDGFRLSYLDEEKLRLQLSENSSGGFQKDIQLSGYDSGQHFVGVKSTGSNLDIFVNGALAISDTTSTIAYPTGTTMNIGASETSSGIADMWEGAVGDILIYNRALTDTEMQEISFFLSTRWELDDVVDSDGDGLVDIYDSSPVDGSILEYNVGATFTWIDPQGANVYLHEGNIQLTGEGGQVEMLKLGSRSGGTSQLDLSGTVTVNTLDEGPGTGALDMLSGTLKLGTSNIDLNFTSGVLTPKDDESHIYVGGIVTLGSASSLVLDVGEKLITNGDVSLAGALQVSVNQALEPGLTIDVLSTSGAITGAFDSITGLPAAEQYYRWETHHITDNGTIKYERDPKYWIYNPGEDTVVTFPGDTVNRTGVAVLPGGKVVSFYLKDDKQPYMRILDSSGQTVVPEFRIDETNYGNSFSPELVRLNSGKVAAVYQVHDGAWKIKFAIFNPDGTEYKPPTLIGDSKWAIDAQVRSRPGSGGFTVTWEKTSGYRVAEYDDDGNVVVADKAVPATSAWSKMAPDSSGNAWGTYYVGTYKNYLQRYDSNYDKVGGSVQISTDWYFDILSFELEPGKVVIGGADKNGHNVMAAVYDANLTNLTGPVTVITNSDYDSKIALSKYFDDTVILLKTGIASPVARTMAADGTLGEELAWPVRQKLPNADYYDGTFASAGDQASGTIAVVIKSRGWKLDRDADGTADTSDAFPDDPTLQSIPNHSVQPPVTSGLKLWLDGKHPYGDEISLSDGDDVTYWIDFSGNGQYFSELESSKKPSFKNTAIGLQSAVYFDQDSVSVKPGVALGAAYTVFAAYDTVEFSDEESGVRTLISRGQQDGFRLSYLDEEELRLQLSENTSGGFQKDIQLSGYDSGQHFIGIKSTGSNLDIHVDGVSVLTDTTTTVTYPTGTTMNIGATETGSGIGDTWEGPIGDVLIYDRALTDDEMQEISYFLSSRWELDDVVDSDADGLVDFYDSSPTDSTVLEYNVGSSFAWIDPQGNSVYLHAGNVQLSGEGSSVETLKLGSRVGYASRLDLSGTVTVNTLEYGPGSGVLNSLSGTLKLGTSNGDFTHSGGILEPKDGQSLIDINGNFTQNNSGELHLTQGEKLDVDGDVVLDGTLVVSLNSGVALVPGLSIDILDATGTSSGEFHTITGLPAAEQYYRWETHHITDNGTIRYERDLRYWVEASSTEITPATTLSGGHKEPSVAELTDGNVVFAYRSGNRRYIRSQIFKREGGIEKSEFIVRDYGSNNNLEHPNVVSLSGGGFSVGYNNVGGAGNDNYYMNMYNNAGTLLHNLVGIVMIHEKEHKTLERNHTGGVIATFVKKDGSEKQYNQSFSSSGAGSAHHLSYTNGSIYYPRTIPVGTDKYISTRLNSSSRTTFTIYNNDSFTDGTKVDGALPDGGRNQSKPMPFDIGNDRILIAYLESESGYAHAHLGIVDYSGNVIDSGIKVSDDHIFNMSLQKISNTEFLLTYTSISFVATRLITLSNDAITVGDRMQLSSDTNATNMDSVYTQDGYLYVTYEHSNNVKYTVHEIAGWRLDRDSDGVADVKDEFPDDPKLQSVPSFTNSLPITSNVMLWLDGSQPHGDIPVTDGEALQSWIDFSGRGNHAQQPTGSMKPVVADFANSGKTGIEFDGSDDFMRLISSVTDQTMDDLAVFVVYKPNGTGDQTLISYDETNYFGLSIMNGGSNKVTFQRDGTGIGSDDKTLESGTYSDTAVPYIVSAAHHKTVEAFTKAFLKVNGNVELENNDVSEGLGYDGISRFGTIGAESSAEAIYHLTDGKHFSGEIAEIIIYDKQLMFSETHMIENYLAKKWNLDNDDNTIEDHFPFHTGVMEVPARTTENIVSDNLVLWFRADKVLGDSTSLSDGDAVRSWVNLASDEHHAFQPDDTKLPTYKENEFDSKPGIYFDGDAFLELPHTSAEAIKSDEYTILIRLKAETGNDSAWGTPFSQRAAIDPGDGFTVYKSDNGLWSHWIGGQGGGGDSWYKANSSRSILVDKEYVITARYDGSTLEIREDGFVLGSTATTVTPAQDMMAGRIGAQTERVVAHYMYKGSIYELLYYNRALTDEELEELEESARSEMPSYDSVWVDSSLGSFGFGSEVSPFASFDDAYEAVNSGGTIYMKNSSFPAARTMTKPVTIETVGGESTLGE